MLLYFISLICLSYASGNGNLYACNDQAMDVDGQGYTFCFFEAKTDGCDPVECLTEVLENPTVENFETLAAGEAFVANKMGFQLTVSAQPWTDGDQSIGSTVSDGSLGNFWAYTLAFSMMAPLRNKMMYAPNEIQPEAEWLKYTNALTDCHIKMDDESGDGNTAFGTDSVRSKLGMGGQSIHTFLQYLEEGSIDLVCLMTDLDMSRCDVIRDTWGISTGTHCDCWMSAYQGIYGVAPNLDDTDHFQTCVEPVTDDTDDDTTDDGTGGNPDGGNGGPGQGGEVTTGEPEEPEEEEREYAPMSDYEALMEQVMANQASLDDMMDSTVGGAVNIAMWQEDVQACASDLVEDDMMYEEEMMTEDDMMVEDDMDTTGRRALKSDELSEFSTLHKENEELRRMLKEEFAKRV